MVQRHGLDSFCIDLWLSIPAAARPRSGQQGQALPTQPSQPPTGLRDFGNMSLTTILFNL